jgi:hypothetical protein
MSVGIRMERARMKNVQVWLDRTGSGRTSVGEEWQESGT